MGFTFIGKSKVIREIGPKGQLLPIILTVKLI